MEAVLSAVIPVFLVVGAAFVVRRAFNLDTRTLATLNIYLFIPALVFSSLSRSEVEWQLLGRFAAAAVLLMAINCGLLVLLARARRMPPDLSSAFAMTAFPNLGNFGLPVVAFAFGREQGLPLAVVVMVCGAFLQNSVGVYFAQRSRYSMGRAFLRVFRFPMIYATVVALVFQHQGWGFPTALSRAVDITADAAIPVQLIILGLSIAETRLSTELDVFLAVAMRLIAGPILAFGVARVIGLEGIALGAFTVQMSAPVAVGMAVYGVQFDVRPRFLSSVVAWSFILSVASVSVVLALLLAM